MTEDAPQPHPLDMDDDVVMEKHSTSPEKQPVFKPLLVFSLYAAGISLIIFVGGTALTNTNTPGSSASQTGIVVSRIAAMAMLGSCALMLLAYRLPAIIGFLDNRPSEDNLQEANASDPPIAFNPSAEHHPALSPIRPGNSTPMFHGGITTLLLTNVAMLVAVWLILGVLYLAFNNWSGAILAFAIPILTVMSLALAVTMITLHRNYLQAYAIGVVVGLAVPLPFIYTFAWGFPFRGPTLGYGILATGVYPTIALLCGVVCAIYSFTYETLSARNSLAEQNAESSPREES